jgi:hypothetical protein
MFKIQILFLFLLFFTPLIWAQSASNFDGVDDKATVYHHSDFNLSTNDFTIEAIVRDVALDQAMLTIISKRDLSTNGFALMLNTHDGIKLIAEIGKDKYEIKTSAFEDKGCHSIGVRRLKGDITLFIDDKAYSFGKNTRDVNTTENLIIGDDGSNTHNPFDGYIEEVRFWNVARSDNQVFDWNDKCIVPSTSGLLALWSIEENSGQFFHDVASVKHHAYLGSGFSNDNQDPLWTSNECLEDCCNAAVGFTVSEPSPKAYQYVNFTNTSTNGSNYQWYVNDVLESTTTDFKFAFPIGTHIIRLLTTGDKCTSMKSWVFEVTDFLDNCGEPININPCLPDPYEANQNQMRILDRFGNCYSPEELALPPPTASRSNVAGYPAGQVCNCGIFTLYFQDVISNTDVGFDNPNSPQGTGFSTLGEERRAVVCRVFEDLSLLVGANPTASNLGVEDLRIHVGASDGTGLLDMPPGAVASGSSYFFELTSPTVHKFASGEVARTIISGRDSYQDWLLYNPAVTSDPHGIVQFNFANVSFSSNLASFTGNHIYIVGLHEAIHALGFASLIGSSTGPSRFTSSNAPNIYSYWDQFLESNQLPVINSTVTANNLALSFTPNTVNSCGSPSTLNGISFDGISAAGSHPVYYNGSYQLGSTFSHYNCTAGVSGYVMNYSGISSVTPNPLEVETLCKLGYTISGTFGQNLTSVNQSNTLANYTACTPSTCIPIGFVDVEDPNNLGNPYTVDRTGTNNQVSINFLDLLLNDVVPVGTTVEDLQILRGGGTLSATSSVGNTLFTYNPNLGFSGWASLSYVPRCSNGELGEVVYVYIWVPAAAAPACNLPTSACNLVCNGDFEAFAPNIFQGNHSQLENYWFSYGNIRALNRSCDLHGYTISNPPGSHPFLCGQIPLPIDFPQKNNYVGIVLNTNTSESFNLELQPGTTLIPSTTDNYRIGFWAWTCQAQDFDVRVAFAPAPPCPSAPFLLSDLEDASGYQPSWMNPLYTGPICTNFGLAADKFNLQVPVSNPNTVGNGSWFYVTHDFHTTVPNLRELIVHLDQVNVNNNLYVLLDNFTIEDLNIPKINISSTIIGSTCRGANPTIRYTIEGDASIPVGSPLTNVQLNITLPTNIPANLSWAAGGDFTSGQYTIPTLAQGDVIVLDLPLNILPNAFIGSSNQVLIEPTIAGACVSAFSNQSTNVIVTNSASQLAISTTILGSTSSSAQYQVEVTNNGTEGIYNIELEVPPVNGLTFSFNPALFDLLPGATQTFTLNSTFSITSGCPVLCAEINSASFACNLPVSGCAPAVTVGTGGNALDFPMQMNAIPTGMTTGSDGSIYATGLFYQNLNFVEGTNINTLNYTGTGGVNVFVVKYDNCGFAWAQEIPINTNTLGLQASPDIEVDGSGNVFTSFIFDNPFLSYTSNGAQDIAIAKFNTTGTLQWIKTDGGLENDLVVDLELYETGSQTHIIIAGYTKGTGTIGTTNTNNATIASTTIPYFNEISSSNFKYLYGVSFIASYLDGSTNPTDQWAEFIDGPTSTSVPTYANNFVPTIPSKIAIDPSGNIYFSGIAYEDFTFPNKSNNATIYPNGFYGTTPSLDLDLFTTSYSLSGTENWCVFYGDDIYGAFGGGEGSRMGIDLEVDNSNNLYLVAPYSYYLNSHETHLVKINTVTGTIAGFTPLTNGNGVIMHSNLAVDNSGNPIVSSNFLLTSSPNNQNIDFYSALPGGQNVSITSGDMIGWAVEKFNSSLGFEWVLANTTITPTSPSDLYLTAPPFDIDIAPNGDIYNCIFVNGDIALNGGTYGPTLTNSDGYIIRIQDQGTGGVYARQATNNNTAQNQNTVSTLSNNTIENTTSNISTKLYPNPTTGKVTLEIKSDKENNKVEQIIIYDVTGRKVQEISTKEQQKLYDINLNSQQSGVYFVEMMINQELITKRVILMK